MDATGTGPLEHPAAPPRLYTALTREGALAEFRKHFLDAGFAAGSLAPRDLVSIDVRVEPVLDLTDPEVLARLGIDPARLVGDRPADRTVCRRAAWAAVRDGHRGVLAPSAAQPGECTLMLYPESHQGRLVVRNGPGRIPINHGPVPLFSPASVQP
jgi:RES domain-containing protein